MEKMITFKDGKLQSYRDSITIEDVMIDGLELAMLVLKLLMTEINYKMMVLLLLDDN